MRLTFLGTAAAEGYPGVFCDCDNCREARALGGKDLRYRAALLVNDDLLLDFGPDLLAAAQRFNLTLAKVTTGLVTHAHEDHFALSNFLFRREAFTGGQVIPTMQLYGPREVAAQLSAQFPDPAAGRLAIHAVHAGDQWQSSGYEITAYDAFHAEGTLETLFYSIRAGEKSFLYATDTGYYSDETWQALVGKVFDVVVMEETMGTGTYEQHLGFESFLKVTQRLRKEGILRPGGQLIAHHLSHSGNPTHAKVEAILGPHGVEVAYDGMVVEVV